MLDGKVEIRVGVRFMFQCVMPKLVNIIFKIVALHRTETHSVLMGAGTEVLAVWDIALKQSKPLPMSMLLSPNRTPNLASHRASFVPEDNCLLLYGILTKVKSMVEPREWPTNAMY